MLRSTRRAKKKGVASRGIAFHRDAVERSVGRVVQTVLQDSRWDFCIGEQEVQGRRHIRMNHLRALTDPVDRNGRAVDLSGAHSALGRSIRRHDRLSRLLPLIRAGTPVQSRNFIGN